MLQNLLKNHLGGVQLSSASTRRDVLPLTGSCVSHAQIIVFCVTAMLTKFYAELFQSLGSPALEIHSRKSQSARTKAADAFRVGTQARRSAGLAAAWQRCLRLVEEMHCRRSVY